MKKQVWLLTLAIYSSSSFAEAGIRPALGLCVKALFSRPQVAQPASSVPPVKTKADFNQMLVEHILEPLSMLEDTIRGLEGNAITRYFNERFRLEPFQLLLLRLMRIEIALVLVAKDRSEGWLDLLFTAFGIDPRLFVTIHPLEIYFRDHPHDLQAYLYLCTQFMDAMDRVILRYSRNPEVPALRQKVDEIRELLARISQDYREYFRLDYQGRLVVLPPPGLQVRAAQ